MNLFCVSEGIVAKIRIATAFTITTTEKTIYDANSNTTHIKFNVSSNEGSLAIYDGRNNSFRN
jgi:hypothetical protein